MYLRARRRSYRVASFIFERVLRALEELVRGPVPVSGQGRAPASNYQLDIRADNLHHLPRLISLLPLRLLDLTEDIKPEVENLGRQPVQDLLAARRYEARDTHRCELAVPRFRHVVELCSIVSVPAKEGTMLQQRHTLVHHWSKTPSHICVSGTLCACAVACMSVRNSCLLATATRART